MALRQTKKISELPALSPASLDTTFVVGISGSTTYKISINNLTSSLDTTFATDLVTNALSNTLDTKLSTSSFNSYTASISTGSLVTSISNLNTFTASQSTSSLVNRLNAIESVSGSWITESETGSFLTSLSGAISGSSQLTSSFDQRYVISGSITQTTWDNIASKPVGIVSSSTQISDLGFVTGSYTTITSFNSLTQSFNSISQSFSVISGSVGTIDFSTLATTASNTFIGNQTISGSTYISGGLDIKNNGYSWSFDSNGKTRIPNITFNSDRGTGMVGIKPVAGREFQIETSTAESSAGPWVFGLDGTLSAPNGANILRVGNLVTTASFNSYTASQSTSSLVDRLNAIENVSGSWITESETGSLQTSITNLNTFTQSFSTSVDSRIDTLEATIISGSPNYTQVLGNQRVTSTSGTSIISGSITTSGNPVQIIVTGDANPIVTTGQWCTLQIYRNDSAIGGVVQVEAANANENQAYCVNVIDTPSAGTYTYSLRMTANGGGNFQFGEATGPVLTAVELRTNTNLPSTNNTFTGLNRFNGQVTLGADGGDEGGELHFATAETNTTLSGSYVSVDIYRDRLRIFDGAGGFKGAHLDISKLPDGITAELMWKVSGFVNAGTFLTLDNLKVSVTTGGDRGLSVGAVSTNFVANISGWYGYVPGGGGKSANNIAYTTTGSTSAFGWGFATEGDGSNYIINDKTNNRVYRVTMMIGAAYNNNFISIERLY